MTPPSPAGTSALQVVGIVGSLRSGSHNRAVLHAAASLAPASMTITEHPLADVPLYNGDVEAAGDPAPVVRLKQAIAEADAVLLVTPEYQHGVPGVLKNALDWASRPPRASALQGKPVAIMGASPGMTGTARAQTQLRQALVYNACPVLPPPEVLISRVHDKLDAGDIVHEATRQAIAGLLDRFVRWLAAPVLADGIGARG